MRKVLRRYLPNPERLRQQRVFALLGEALLHPRLWHLNRRAAANAVAIGLFCGLIPGPLQMISAAVLCLICRANLPLALIVTLYTNPLTIVPLYLAAFVIGRFVTRSDASFVPPPDVGWHSLGEAANAYWHWFLNLGEPLAVGLPLLACLLAACGYFATKLVWRGYLIREIRRRRARRRCE